VENIQSLISNFSNREVKLRIFDEMINDESVNTDYLNQYCTS
jgi:hypothetical protein